MKVTSYGVKLVTLISVLLIVACGAIGILSYLFARQTLLAEVDTLLALEAKNAAQNIKLREERFLAESQGAANRPDSRSVDWARQKPAWVENTQHIG